MRDGWSGWDAYAPFYDWENARTRKVADVRFWRHLAARSRGRVLELGCGTGRISVPLARAGVSLVGIDRSAPMLAQAHRKFRTARIGTSGLIRGDIRALPFAPAQFSMVLAPYGILQSLLSDRDLRATLDSIARVLATGGTLGIDLVPDVPRWKEYRNRLQLRGPATRGAHLTLIESVRQDRRKRLTTFEQRYLERKNGRVAEHRFEIAFRTIPVRAMVTRLEQAGFALDAVVGDYQGGPWDERADVWIILAKKV
jgi:ubiquinone/menaquinone biosynthesis C-methylase UbiE